MTDDFFINCTGTATSPIDAIVEGLQDLQGSSDAKINLLYHINDSFKNETSIPQIFNQDQTIRSRTAGAANRSRGHANSKSRSRIIFFKSDSKFYKNGKNKGSRSYLNIQSPISSIISKSPLLHKSISKSLLKNQLVIDVDAENGGVVVQKFEQDDQEADQREDGEKNAPEHPFSS